MVYELFYNFEFIFVKELFKVKDRAPFLNGE
jgi:hypothetical protein